MNINDLIPVTKSNVRSTKERYDLSYSAKSDRFSLSEAVISKLGLENKGLTVMVHPVTKQVFLAVVEEEDAVFFKGRKGTENKTPSFKNQMLRKHLDENGVTTVGMNLVEVEEIEDLELYEVVANEDAEQYSAPEEVSEDTESDED